VKAFFDNTIVESSWCCAFAKKAKELKRTTSSIDFLVGKFTKESL
jgi:hypothetical protein